jgi:hypothetical protein
MGLPSLWQAHSPAFKSYKGNQTAEFRGRPISFGTAGKRDAMLRDIVSRKEVELEAIGGLSSRPKQVAKGLPPDIMEYSIVIAAVHPKTFYARQQELESCAMIRTPGMQAPNS